MSWASRSIIWFLLKGLKGVTQVSLCINEVNMDGKQPDLPSMSDITLNYTDSNDYYTMHSILLILYLRLIPLLLFGLDKGQKRPDMEDFQMRNCHIVN